MLISRTRFFQYQSMFYKKLLNTPYSIRLEVVTIQKIEPTEEFSMDAFVGDSPRTSTFYEFQALYEKEIPNRTREKYGLPKEVNGVVYLSPKQLVPKLGYYHLDWNKTKIHFEVVFKSLIRLFIWKNFTVAASVCRYSLRTI